MKSTEIKYVTVATALARTIKNARSFRYYEAEGRAHAHDGIYYITETRNHLEIEFRDELDNGGFRLFVKKNIVDGHKVFVDVSTNYEKRFAALCRSFGV